MMTRHIISSRFFPLKTSSVTRTSQVYVHFRLSRKFSSLVRCLEKPSVARTTSRTQWHRQHASVVQQSHFHTTPKRYVPPVFWYFFKPIAKIGAILSGRLARKWWQNLPAKRRRYFWGRVRQRWYYVVLVVGAACGAGVAYYKTHVETTPLTGRERFIAVTHEQFMKIANAEAGAHLLQYEDKIVPITHPACGRVVRVFKRLLKANPDIMELMGKIKWRVYIVHDPSINAFVLPTGHVFIFSGILEFAENDDQLAVVLAHEMAHALLNHGIEQVSYAQLTDFLIITTMAAIWCIMPNDGISFITHWFYHKFIKIMLQMPYSRMMEKEADKVGLQLAAKACYDVREGSVFWQRMAAHEKLLTSNDQMPEWLSTHPSHEKRVELFDFLIPKALEIRQAAKCPQLSAKDPRERIKVLNDVVENELRARKSRQNVSKVSSAPSNSPS